MGLLNRHQFKNHKIGDRVSPGLDTGPGMTKQEFAKECDINHIMKRYGATGQLPIRSDLQPVFADVSGIGDYADVLRRIDASRDAFRQLSPELRARFNNQPDALVEFLADTANRDEAVKLGLIAAPVKDAAAPDDKAKAESSQESKKA